MVGKFREKLRSGRRVLHDRMGDPALYFAPPYVGGDTVVTPITVRVHEHFGLLGDLKGTNFNYAEVEDQSPRIVFMRDEITPVRNMVVSVAPGQAYRVDTVSPPNDITVTARVVRLMKEDAEGLPVPGDLIPQNVRIEIGFPSFDGEGVGG